MHWGCGILWQTCRRRNMTGEEYSIRPSIPATRWHESAEQPANLQHVSSRLASAVPNFFLWIKEAGYPKNPSTTAVKSTFVHDPPKRRFI